MTDKRTLEWKFFEQDMRHDNLSRDDLQIMDAKEILNYVELESDNNDNVKSDDEFKLKICNIIYKEVCSGKDKGTIEYQVSYTLA